jgi:predicted ABC-type ATPase
MMESADLTADGLRSIICGSAKGDTSSLLREIGSERDERRALIVAGPNGAGKTTFAREYLRGHDTPYLSADAIAERMTDGDIREAMPAAGKKFISRLNGVIESGNSFVLETTLSGRGFHRTMRRMKRRGYAIDIIFIYLGSPEFCYTRIRERTRKGGHHVPAEDVNRRFHRSIDNFKDMYRREAHGWILVSNDAQQFVEVARGQENGRMVFEEQAYMAFTGDNDLGSDCEPIDPRISRKAEEIRRIGNRAVYKAQEESRRFGVPNAYLINERIYYELPTGALSLDDPCDK